MDTPKYKLLKDWDGHLTGDIVEASVLPVGEEVNVDTLLRDEVIAVATEEDLKEAASEEGSEDQGSDNGDRGKLAA